MIWEIGSVAKHLLLPPLAWCWLLLFGLIYFRRKPRAARWSLAAGLLLLYASATSWVAGGLMRLVVDETPVARGKAPQAVVILAGGRTLEFDAAGRVVRARLGPSTSERVIEGVRIARETKLPVLVTSGKPDGLDPAEAVVMRDVMERELGMTPRWVESASRNTVENALFSAPLLKRDGIDSIILVTHGYHMRRARYLFEQAGLRVVPAVLDPHGSAPFSWGRLARDLLPTAGAWGTTFLACNEIAGLAYARWRSSSFTAAATPSAAVAN